MVQWTYLERYGRRGAEKGWHFLTGNEPSIKRLTEAVGFRYTYDPRTDQFAHASGILVLTPAGKISRYFYDVHYSPRDLRLGLVEASAGRVGSAHAAFISAKCAMGAPPASNASIAKRIGRRGPLHVNPIAAFPNRRNRRCVRRGVRAARSPPSRPAKARSRKSRDFPKAVRGGWSAG